MKRNALSLVVLETLMLLFSACSGNVNNGGGTGSPGVQMMDDDEKVSFTSADRKAFGLKGDVKECKGNPFGDITFDEKGRLVQVEGITVKYDADANDAGELYFGPVLFTKFSKGVNEEYFKRNTEGLITVLIANPAWFAFEYDEQGFCSKVQLGDGQMITHDYQDIDENGNPAICKFGCVDDMGENVADWVYEYTKFDDKGNWIERKKTVTKDSYTSWETQEVAVSTPNVTHVETREITYF
jgi:hypothetical protein